MSSSLCLPSIKGQEFTSLQIYFLSSVDKNVSVDRWEDLGDVVDDLPVGGLQPTALYHQVARLVHVINHHRVDIESFVG